MTNKAASFHSNTKRYFLQRMYPFCSSVQLQALHLVPAAPYTCTINHRIWCQTQHAMPAGTKHKLQDLSEMFLRSKYSQAKHCIGWRELRIPSQLRELYGTELCHCICKVHCLPLHAVGSQACILLVSFWITCYIAVNAARCRSMQCRRNLALLCSLCASSPLQAQQQCNCR